MKIKKIAALALLATFFQSAYTQDAQPEENKNRIDSVPYNERNISNTTAGANEFEQMIIALSHPKPDFNQAFYYAKASAKLNFCQTFGYIGTFYMHGLGVETNLDEAYNAYTKGEKCSDIQSVYGLASLYGAGYTDPEGKSGETAVIEYLEKASALDYAPAQYELAVILLKRNSKDKRGMDLLQKAANDRYGPAIEMYYSKYGVQDKSQ